MRSRSLIWVPCCCLLLLSAHAEANDRGVNRVQVVIDELKAQLAISAEVTAITIPYNKLLVSVSAQRDPDGGFEMSFEDGFVERLDDDELRAVVAHELGHVWIFTHHPYLQTERGANDIALRVVSRQSLERIYERVWAREGAKGDLSRFLSSLQ